MASNTTIRICLTLAGAIVAAGFWVIAADTPVDHAAKANEAERAKGNFAAFVPVIERPVEHDATPILDEVRRVGASSPGLAALPEPDRAWVLGRVSMAFTVGQTPRELLPQHIEELASVRQFAVLEREAPYIPPEEAISSPETHNPEAH